jgi:DNA-binding HxlR family transcriptional regulator
MNESAFKSQAPIFVQHFGYATPMIRTDHNPALDDDFCAVHEAMKILQGKWTLQIVGALLHGPSGFNELSRAVGGCNSATLSRRLEALARLGLLVKHVESTMPPRTCYTLTPAGQALHEVVASITRWSEAYLPRSTDG